MGAVLSLELITGQLLRRSVLQCGALHTPWSKVSPDLSWMFGQAEPPTGKLARWVLKKQQFQPFGVKYRPGGESISDALSRELIAWLVAAIELVKRISNVEELREDPTFEWILKALKGDESGCQRKTTRRALRHSLAPR